MFYFVSFLCNAAKLLHILHRLKSFMPALTAEQKRIMTAVFNTLLGFFTSHRVSVAKERGKFQFSSQGCIIVRLTDNWNHLTEKKKHLKMGITVFPHLLRYFLSEKGIVYPKMSLFTHYHVTTCNLMFPITPSFTITIVYRVTDVTWPNLAE